MGWSKHLEGKMKLDSAKGFWVLVLTTICCILCVVALGIALFSPSNQPGIRERQLQQEKEEYLQNRANGVIREIQYIKDEQTGLCFAYYWGGAANGGPALTVVPCEVVPTNLITTVQKQGTN